MLRSGATLHAQLQAALAEWDASRSTERLWERDGSLWPGDAGAWLGWLDAAAHPADALASLAADVRAATPPGTREVLLIGMGGSSLAPEVIANVVPAGPGGLALRVLDSTHPTAVRAALDATDWKHTLAVVASKSGTTLEPDVLFAAALAHARAALGDAAASRFAVITDPGSRLERDARALGCAGVFHGEPTIGGRFSALSPFGLVHVVLRGLDHSAFLAPARTMADACRGAAPGNPGVQLGAFLGVAARAGRDKCTLLLPPSLAPLGAWIEQLVAESTGKQGVAILPIDGERGDAATWGNDRAFVLVSDAAQPDAGVVEQARVAEAAGHPVFRCETAGASALAGEFFRWEFATAVAGALLGVNPFDQPDVEASKLATRGITDAIERGQSPARASAAGPSLAEALASVAAGDYVALLAFLPMHADVHQPLQRVRERIAAATRAATVVGFGPRYLHSTGQAFKGGPNTGVFVVLTWDGAVDLPIPGRRATFGAVVAAQAAGDVAVLRQRGRRVCHLHLRGELHGALAGFEGAVASALARRLS